MLSQEFSHIPSLPHHAHVSERAKATLGVAEASEATCNSYHGHPGRIIRHVIVYIPVPINRAHNHSCGMLYFCECLFELFKYVIYLLFVFLSPTHCLMDTFCTRQVSEKFVLMRSNWSVLRPFLEMARVYSWPSTEMLVMLISIPTLPFAPGLYK